MMSFVAVEVDMSDISGVKCRIIPSSSEWSCPNDYASKVFQRCVCLFYCLQSCLL